MTISDWFRPPRHLLALFVAATVVPALALGWMAWVSLGQDAALDRQRVQDTLDAAAGRIASDLQRRLEEQSRRLAALVRAPPVSLPGDAVLLTVADGGVAERPAGRLLYFPSETVRQTQRTDILAAGAGGDAQRTAAIEAAAALEFQAQNPEAAAGAFRHAADAGSPSVQAQALLGLARCLRKLNRPQDALGVYDRLAQLGPTSVEGVPADLVARHARCALQAALKATELSADARDLLLDLQRPRWVLDRASFEFYSGEARGWLPADAVPSPPPARLALADAAEGIESLSRTTDGAPWRGWTTLWRRGCPLLVIWQNVPGGMIALVTGPSWLERPAAAWTSEKLLVALTDTDGHSHIGQSERLPKPVAVAAAADTGLPWTVRVASADPGRVPSLLARNRRLVFGGFAVVGLLIVVGGFLVARALARELAVARLQRDFVSAVSHEFRSPLTSMKHLIEMLDQDAVPSEDRRRQYYRVLNAEAERLHKMVEDLLNFGRMEAGKAEYRYERLDVRALAGQVASEFAGQLVPPDRLDVSVAGPPSFVNADREALARAIRNLLDNAAKYSPPEAPIRLGVDEGPGTVSIRVCDEGAGIPADEQKMIFTKFYRGADATRSGVQGTGLGLATVQHIVRAHNGDVRIDSAPGRGSAFSIVLPHAKEPVS